MTFLRDERHANGRVIESASKPLFALLQDGGMPFGMFSLGQRNLYIFQIRFIGNVDDGDYWSGGDRTVETDQGNELGDQEGGGSAYQVGHRGPEVARAPGGPERLVHLAACI